MRETRNGEHSPTGKLSARLARGFAWPNPKEERPAQPWPNIRIAGDSFPAGRDIHRKSPNARERWHDPSMESLHPYTREGGAQSHDNSSRTSASSCEGYGDCVRWRWNHADI